MDHTPIKLSPAFKDYIWGGDKLIKEFGKKSDSEKMEKIAESWELSAHKDGESKVADGPFKGLTLSEYISAAGKDVLGSRSLKYSYFPLLIKLIDAKADLSVQVHPDDEYALTHEGEYGKTEMWYIIDCEEGASLYYGFERDITKEEYEAAKAEELKFVRSEASEFEQEIYSYYEEVVYQDVINDLMEQKGINEKTAKSLLLYGGYQIYSCIDMDIQNIVDKYYTDMSKLPKPWRNKDIHFQSAMVIMDPFTGEIVALSGGTGENGKTSTANFVSGLMKSVPPLSEIFDMAGMQLPEYLGKKEEAEEKAPSDAE